MNSSSHRSATSATTTTTTMDDHSSLEQLPSVQLEALADAFQEQLMTSLLVKDHPSKKKSKVYAKSFTGHGAVSVLQTLLQEQEQSEGVVSREEARNVGRDIQRRFRFFVHVKCPSKNSSKHNTIMELEDTPTDLYQFHYNLPMQVYQMKKQYPSLWDKAQLLEELTPIGSHRGITKVHKDCFVAKQAVDVLVEVKLVKSRGQAVHLVRKMNEKIMCCRLVMHPGNDGTNFRDDNNLYCFVPQEQRITEQEAASPKKKVNKNKTNSSKASSSNSTSSLKTTGMMDQSSKSERRCPRTTSARLERERKNNSTRSCMRTTSARLERSHRTIASVKDASYFRDRASGIRAKLDCHRQMMRAAPSAC